MNASRIKKKEKNHARGHRIFSRVGAQLLRREIFEMNQQWKENLGEYKSQVKGEKIMRRVGVRLLMADCLRMVNVWKSDWLEFCLERDNQLRAQHVLKRVGVIPPS